MTEFTPRQLLDQAEADHTHASCRRDPVATRIAADALNRARLNHVERSPFDDMRDDRERVAWIALRAPGTLPWLETMRTRGGTTGQQQIDSLRALVADLREQRNALSDENQRLRWQLTQRTQAPAPTQSPDPL